MADCQKRACYVLEDIADMEEDLTHEFKCHCNIAIEEIPPWCWVSGTNKRTRAPISKTLCAFLNSEEGGTVYLGIADDGTIKGIKLTQYQKDHIGESLKDTLSRYTPPVEPHRYKVKFVPVVEPDLSDVERKLVVQYDTRLNVDDKMRSQPHALRTHQFCWCAKEARSRLENGKIPPDYIIEIRIKKWDPDDERNKEPAGAMKAQTLFQDECNKAYFRRQASVNTVAPGDIIQLAKQRAQDYYLPKIKSLREQVTELREKLQAKKSEEDQ